LRASRRSRVRSRFLIDQRRRPPGWRINHRNSHTVPNLLEGIVSASSRVRAIRQHGVDDIAAGQCAQLGNPSVAVSALWRECSGLCSYSSVLVLPTVTSEAEQGDACQHQYPSGGFRDRADWSTDAEIHLIERQSAPPAPCQLTYRLSPEMKAVTGVQGTQAGLFSCTPVIEPKELPESTVNTGPLNGSGM
jgi:hypothetical protein